MEKLTELEDALKSANAEDMRTFASLVVHATELLNITDERLAIEFSVSIPTVQRWKEGVNAPYHGTRGLVLDYFSKRLAMVKLVEELKTANPRTNSLFPTLVVRVVEALNLSDRDIALRFSASRPTVQRWKTGEGMPHPAMRVVVYKHFVDCLEARLADLPIPD